MEKHYVYTLRDKRRVLYIGRTNDPGRREQEHRTEGKRGRLQVEEEFSFEIESADYEAAMLADYRETFGRNPEYNKTDSGEWEPQTRRILRRADDLWKRLRQR